MNRALLWKAKTCTAASLCRLQYCAPPQLACQLFPVKIEQSHATYDNKNHLTYVNLFTYPSKSHKSHIPHMMDYQGQGRAELLYEFIILACTIGGAIVAFITQQFSYALYSHVAGFVLSCIICLPPWPMFKRKPVKWQPAVKVEE